MRPIRQSTRRKLSRGLTLIEISLAIAVLAIIATLTWGSMARAFDAYETVTDIDRRYHNIRVAMNRMSKELSMAFLTSVRRVNDRDREIRWQTLFKSESGSPFQVLHFTAFAHEILRADAKESDQCEIAYFGATDPDNPRQINLMRREDPRLDEEPDEGGRAFVLAENIKDFKLRFFDPKDDDWTDEWDTEDREFAGRLPSIVEITMVTEDENGNDLKFVTKTRINLIQELGRL